MLACIPPITTRTYLWYRFQWSICSFSLSPHDITPLKKKNYGSFFFPFFSHMSGWYFYLNFFFLSSETTEGEKKRNSSEFFFSYCCSMRNDRLHQRWTLGDLCEIEMIKRTRFLDSVKPNNSTGFVFPFFSRTLFWEGGVCCRHDILYNM